MGQLKQKLNLYPVSELIQAYSTIPLSSNFNLMSSPFNAFFDCLYFVKKYLSINFTLIKFAEITVFLTVNCIYEWPTTNST